MKKFFILLLAAIFLILQLPNLTYAESRDAEIIDLPNLIYAEPNDTETIYLPILMYHQISKNPAKLGSYVISDTEFESDLKLLKKYGYTTITVQELLDHIAGDKNLPDKPILITFDDGFESDYAYAFPLLKKYNMKAAFSVIGKYTDLYSKDVRKHINYSHLSWEEVKEMHESGLAEFHSHTYDMHLMDNRRGALKKKNESLEQYQKALGEDLGRLNKAYAENIGVMPTAFTCPFGCYNSNLKETVKGLGFSVILTSNQKINKLTGDPEELYSLNRYVRSHGKDVEKLINSWEGMIAFDKSSKNQIKGERVD